MRTFPVFLIGAKLQRVLIVGGNHEAARKVDELMAAQVPQIDVVAARLCAALAERIDGRRIRHHARAYRPEDLDGAALVIATDLDKALNARIWADAAGRGILVNCLDDPERCHYYNGSVVHRGELSVAISTGGSSPVAAVRLRERFEAELGEEWGRFIELSAEVRPIIQARIARFAQRKALWYQLIDSDIMALLAAGELSAARAQALELIEAAADPADSSGGTASAPPALAEGEAAAAAGEPVGESQREAARV